MVAGHVVDGATPEQSDAVEFALVQEHVGEAQVVVCGSDEPAASAEHRRWLVRRPPEGVRRRHGLAGRRVADVQRGEAVHRLVGHVEVGVGHPERLEDAGAEELVERHAGHDLDEAAQDVRRHAVVPLAARLERQRHLGPQRAALGERGARRIAPLEPATAVDRIGDVGVVEPVRESGGVGEEVPHTNRFDLRFGHWREERTRPVHPGVGELRQPLGDRRLQLEQALLVEHHRGDRGDGLGHREHPHDGVVGERCAGGDVSMACRRRVDELAGPTDGDVPSGELLLFDVSLEVAVDPGESVGGEARVGGGDVDLQCWHRASLAHERHHRRVDDAGSTLWT